MIRLQCRRILRQKCTNEVEKKFNYYQITVKLFSNKVTEQIIKMEENQIEMNQKYNCELSSYN